MFADLAVDSARDKKTSLGVGIRAIVDVDGTRLTCVTEGTFASKSAVAIRTGSTILTRISRTVVEAVVTEEGRVAVTVALIGSVQILARLTVTLAITLINALVHSHNTIRADAFGTTVQVVAGVSNGTRIVGLTSVDAVVGSSDPQGLVLVRGTQAIETADLVLADVGVTVTRVAFGALVDTVRTEDTVSTLTAVADNQVVARTRVADVWIRSAVVKAEFSKDISVTVARECLEAINADTSAT